MHERAICWATSKFLRANLTPVATGSVTAGVKGSTGGRSIESASAWGLTLVVGGAEAVATGVEAGAEDDTLAGDEELAGLHWMPTADGRPPRVKPTISMTANTPANAPAPDIYH